MLGWNAELFYITFQLIKSVLVFSQWSRFWAENQTPPFHHVQYNTDIIYSEPTSPSAHILTHFLLFLWDLFFQFFFKHHFPLPSLPKFWHTFTRRVGRGDFLTLSSLFGKVFYTEKWALLLPIGICTADQGKTRKQTGVSHQEEILAAAVAHIRIRWFGADTRDKLHLVNTLLQNTKLLEMLNWGAVQRYVKKLFENNISGRTWWTPRHRTYVQKKRTNFRILSSINSLETL